MYPHRCCRVAELGLCVAVLRTTLRVHDTDRDASGRVLGPALNFTLHVPLGDGAHACSSLRAPHGPWLLPMASTFQDITLAFSLRSIAPSASASASSFDSARIFPFV